MYINPYKLFCGSFVPDWLIKTDIISANAKLIYARMCRFAGENGEAFPKLETLAAEVGMPMRTMQRGLKELIDSGMLEAQRHGLGKPNSYRFLVHPLMGITPPDLANPDTPQVANQDWPCVANLDTPQVANPIYDEESHIRESYKENTPQTPQGGNVYFEDFWNSWPDECPRKVRKKDAREFWAKHNLDEQVQDIKRGLGRWIFSEEWHRDKGAYIPQPVVWLRGERWKDKPKLDRAAMHRAGIKTTTDEVPY